jgi:hypothetical protein
MPPMMFVGKRRRDENRRHLIEETAIPNER